MKISNRVKWYFVVAVALLFGMLFMLGDMCCDDDRDIEVLLRQSNLRSVYTLVYQYVEQQGMAPDPSSGLIL